MRFLTVLLLVGLLPHAIGKSFDASILGQYFPEDFFKWPSMTSLALSPSGKNLAYASSSRDRHFIYVLNSSTMEKGLYFGENFETDFITYINWKDENRIIYQTKGGNLYLQTISPHKRTLIYDARRYIGGGFFLFWGDFAAPRVLSMLPNDDTQILISAIDKSGTRQPYFVDLETGKERLAMKNRNDIDVWHADQNGDLRLGVNFTNKRHQFFYLPQGSKSWKQFDNLLPSGAAPSFNLGTSNVMDRRDYFLGFDFDPSQFYFASNRESDKIRIYKYDTNSNTAPVQVAADDEYDFMDLTSYNFHPLVSKKRKAWVGFHYQRDKPATHWIDSSFKQVQEQVDQHLPDSTNLLIDWADDETNFLVSSTDGAHPPAFHLFDATQNYIRRVGSLNDDLAEAKLTPTQPIEFTSRDGLRIHGYLTLAPPTDGKPAPAVLLVHGGPWARDTYGFDPSVQWLAYNGYTVLQANFRGSTGYGYEHFIASRHEFGWGIQRDLEDAIDWAEQAGHLSSERLAIMGFSYGAYASLLAIGKHPEKFRCAIAISGIYDLVKETKEIKGTSKSGLTYASWKSMVGQEVKDRAKLEEISPIKYISNIQRPLFIAHGEADPIASIEHAEDLVAALKDGQKDFRYHKLPGEGHSIMNPKHQALVFEGIAKFLKQHLSNSDK